jgi:phage head maturation protease
MRSAARQVALPTLQRQAALVPQSLDVDGRTVEVVWTTGARIRRQGYWDDEPWFEELSVADGAVDLSRLNAGAAVLDSHQSSGVRNVLGAVEPKSARLENGHGLARIQFSRRPDVADVIEDIRAGIIRNLSVGYTVDALEEIEPADRKAGTLACFRATRWQPVELSFVAVGADAGAQVRAEAASTQPCLITRRSDMDEETTVVERPKAKRPVKRTRAEEGRPPGEGGEQPGEGEEPEVPPPAPKPPEDDEEASAAAARAERKRIQEIRQAIRNGGLPEDFADRFIDEGTPAAAVPKAVLTERARCQAPVSRSTIEVVGAEGLARMRAGIVEALLHRVDPMRHPITDVGRDWRGYTLRELGRTCLEARGIRTKGLGPQELFALALGVARPDQFQLREGPHSFITSTDFPTLLAQVGRAQLTAGYSAAAPTFPPWTRQGTLPDFRPTNRISLGLGPKFLKVQEHGEYTRGPLATVPAEAIQLSKFGRILAFTWEAMVNDDVGLFARIPQLFGNAAAAMESDTVYGILTGNPPMVDTFALFSAQHGNLMTASVIDVKNMALARAAMMNQKSADGQYINITPRFLIVGPAQEVYALQFLAPLTIVSATNQNVPTEYQSLKLVVDPRITDNAWYLAADPAQIDTIEYDYLEGAAGGGPTLETKEGWDIDGQEYKAKEAFGAAAIDYRGLVKNPGMLPA